jgi:hypothetical protein
MFRADVLVFEPPGLFLSPLEDLVEARCQVNLCRTIDLWELPEFLAQCGRQLLRAGADLLENRDEDSLGLLDETQQEVFGVHRLVLHLLGDLLRSLDGFLSLERELLKPHGFLLFLSRTFSFPYNVFNIKLESIHVNIEQHFTSVICWKQLNNWMNKYMWKTRSL